MVSPPKLRFWFYKLLNRILRVNRESMFWLRRRDDRIPQCGPWRHFDRRELCRAASSIFVLHLPHWVGWRIHDHMPLIGRSMPNPTSWGNPLLRLRLNRFERFGFFFALSLRFTTRWESVSVSVWMDCSVPQEYMATNRNANFCLLFFTRQQRGNRGTLKIGFLTSALRLRLFTYIFPCLANKHDS